MLEKLEQIDWNSVNLKEAPEWIRALTSQKQQEFDQAYQKIDAEIIQGKYDFEDVELGYGISKTLGSDGPLLVLPFLLELLMYETVLGKNNILSLLCTMVDYINMRYEGEIYAQKARTIRDEIWAYKNTFFDLLSHQNPLVRRQVFNLLSLYPEHLEEVAPRLMAHLEQEHDNEAKLYMLWALSGLPQSSDLLERMTILYKVWLLSDVVNLQASATFYLIRILKERAPEKCDSIIVQMMVLQNTTYPMPPFFLGLDDWASSLVNLGKVRGIPLALEIMNRAQNPEASIVTLLAALLLAFDRPDLLPELTGRSMASDITGLVEITFLPKQVIYLLTNRELDESQKQVLHAAVKNNALWSIKSNLLDILGLPSQRGQLANILNNSE
jgi:hypothetical protein